MLHFTSQPNLFQVRPPPTPTSITCMSSFNLTKVPANHRAGSSGSALSTCFRFLIPWYRPLLETSWSLSRIPRQLFSAKPQHMFWVYQTWLTGSPSVRAIRPSPREELAVGTYDSYTLWLFACSYKKQLISKSHGSNSGWGWLEAKMIWINPALCFVHSNSLAVHSFCHQLHDFCTMLLFLNKVNFGFAPVACVTVQQSSPGFCLLNCMRLATTCRAHVRTIYPQINGANA